jgi:hypothetical protein
MEHARNSKTLFVHPHSDHHLGSPRYITDGTPGDPTMGQIVGERMVGNFNGKQFPSGYRPLTGWTGHANEDATGLIYMRGRHYSPTSDGVQASYKTRFL